MTMDARIEIHGGGAVVVRIEKVESGEYVMFAVRVLHDEFDKETVLDTLGPFASELEADMAVEAVLVGAKAVNAARPSCHMCN
jgi:hypothetical protein